MRDAGVLLCVTLALGACHRSATTGDADASAVVEAAVVAPSIVPARCHARDSGLVLDDGGVDDLEIGDVAFTGGQIALGIVHHGPTGRAAAVALMPGAATSLAVHDLTPTLGDAPPPRLVGRDKDVLALAYGRVARGSDRELKVFGVSLAGDVSPLGSVTESHDDSLAYDLSPTLMVWDDTTTGPAPRGVIRAADLSAEGRPGAARDLSPATSDAEMPRIQSLGAGALVFWIARKTASPVAPDAAPGAEVTGEERGPAWLEVLPVDGHGVPAGAPRRLTSTSGHVSTFDLASPSRAPGAVSDAVLVAVRDDGEAIDGSGGQLLRLRVRADGEDPPLAYPTDGLGRGAPSFVDGSPPWLVWVAPREETRLLPLDAKGVPTRPPSVEPSLDDARPLALLGGGTTMLAAAPSDPAGQLRTLECAP